MTPLEQMQEMAARESARIKERPGTDTRSLEMRRFYKERRERIRKELSGRTFRYGVLLDEFGLSPSMATKLLGQIGAKRIKHGVYEVTNT